MIAAIKTTSGASKAHCSRLPEAMTSARKEKNSNAMFKYKLFYYCFL